MAGSKYARLGFYMIRRTLIRNAMQRNITLSLVLYTSLSLTAQLAPQSSAPVGEHLLEVNAQWAAQDPIALANSEVIHFNNEAERIRHHLELVRERLLERTPEGLSAEQLQARFALLDDLGDYAQGEQFPRNHVLPYRNPVFIDPYGTACAVGQLMIESGSADLALSIQNEMNLAYVLDMGRSDVLEWATTNGFTANELAWIQPGYPPSVPWMPLGEGTNGPVKVLLTLGSGDLLVAGDFTEAGGEAMNMVALWNGADYVPLGTGIQGQVNCATEFAGSIYIGGNSINGISDLAVWNGTTWSHSVVFDGKFPNINALHVHDGTLYAAGQVMGFAGVDDIVKRKVGDYWEDVGSIFNDAVLSLGTHNGDLVAGGSFTQMVTVTDPITNHVARFDGTDWLELGGGLDATVRCLLEVDGELYAGGDLFANVIPTFGLAKMESGAMEWTNLLPEHATYMSSGPGPSYIASLVERDGMFYFGGQFGLEFLMVYGNHIGSFNGQPDGVAPMALLNNEVHTVAIVNDRLVMGGAFDLSYPHVAVVDISTDISSLPDTDGNLVTYPQPANDRLTIETLGIDLSKAAIRVVDAEGRAVPVPITRQSGKALLDVQGLAPGTYLVSIAVGDQLHSTRFIKE